MSGLKKIHMRTVAINATMQLLKNCLENYDEDNPKEWLNRIYLMFLQICLRGERLVQPCFRKAARTRHIAVKLLYVFSAVKLMTDKWY